MTRRLVYGRYTDLGNRALAVWVARKMPELVSQAVPQPFGECECVGVYEDRRLIAAVVFHSWDPMAKVLFASMAATTPMWAKQETIFDVLRVPFELMMARKLYVAIRSDNTRVVKFVKHIGFKEEGRLSEHFAPGLHAVILGLKRSRFSSLVKRFDEGQRVRRAACA